MIEVTKLTKKYGDFLAVNNISFNVKQGEILGFLGPNGAGKTTTMRIIAGYMPPTAGTTKVAGYDVFEEPIKVKSQIGYLPENSPLYGHMTVKDYLLFMAEIKGVAKAQRKSRLNEALHKCWLEDVQDRLVSHLSKGYKQRVGIAQALIHDPPVLILDEPTIGLDPKQIIQVRNMIRSLKGDHTIILSTHILPEVSMTCDRIVIINKGQVVAMDTPEALSKRLKGTEKIYLQVMGAVDKICARLGTIKGVLNVSTHQDGIIVENDGQADIRPYLAEIIVKNKWKLLEMRSVGMSLEEIFLQLTTVEKTQITQKGQEAQQEVRR